MGESVVLGAGSWGTALACLLAENGSKVSLWCRDEAHARQLDLDRENKQYLPGISLQPNIVPITTAPSQSDLWLLAVPSSGFREACSLLPTEPCRALIATKGLELGSALRMSEIVAQVRPDCTVGVISGPNLAMEVARGIPTASVVASNNKDFACEMQHIIATRSFRVYHSTDAVGVELGGALKNVYALGAGMSDGLGFGDNTKGAFLARALREMATLGVALGAEHKTFLGLSGVGDLFATAVSKLSRNYRVGRFLAEGITADAAIEKIGQVAEGVPTSSAAQTLAERVGLPIPLMLSIRRVVSGDASPLQALADLMNRPAGPEFD